MMNVLIVEDEKAAARNLASLLEEIDPAITVLSTVDSVVDCVEWLGINPPADLIFMDIHLADGAAFDIFERCAVESPVVFTTAYDEYALKAFKVNSIDYLLKPISREDLERAVAKFRRLHRPEAPLANENLQNLLRTIQRAQNRTTHLLLSKGGSRLMPLPIADVMCFFIEDGVVKACTSEGRSHVVNYTLDQLSEMVDPERFFRANRQYLVAKEDVADMELWFGSRLLLRLKSQPAARIVVNKPRVTEFKQWLSGCKIRNGNDF